MSHSSKSANPKDDATTTLAINDGNDNSNGHYYYYYRVAFRGVVALLTEPDWTAPKSTTARVGHGEVVGSYARPMRVVTRKSSANPNIPVLTTPPPMNKSMVSPPPPPPPPPCDDTPTADNTTTIEWAIRVDAIFTGGYAATTTTSTTTATATSTNARVKSANPNNIARVLPLEEEDETPKRSNLTQEDSATVGKGTTTTSAAQSTSESGGLGYIFLQSPLSSENATPRTPLLTALTSTSTTELSSSLSLHSHSQPQQPPCMFESGPFWYKITATSPVPIRTGPAADAPPTPAVALPGTTQAVALRWKFNCDTRTTAETENDFTNSDNNNNVDEHNADLWFLRLQHGRGWILSHQRDRHGRYRSVVQEIQQTEHDDNGSLAAASRSSAINNDNDDDSSHRQGSISSLLSSTTTSTMLATASRASTLRRRHRPPRGALAAGQQQQQSMHNQFHSQPLPRHVRTIGLAQQQQQHANTSNPTVTPTKPQGTSRGEVGTPTSMISMLSEDSEEGGHRRLQKTWSGAPPSPDVSYATSAGPAGSTTTTATTTISNPNRPPREPPKRYYLMRVNAPRGLKILDAPQYQVNNFLMKPPKNHHSHDAVASSHSASQMMMDKSSTHSNSGSVNHSLPHHSIFQTMTGGRHTTTTSTASANAHSRNPVVVYGGSNNNKTRILPRGALFEASSNQRLQEKDARLTPGAGLIKLSDNTGWAIVPRQDELDQQYRHYLTTTNTSNSAGVKEGEASRAYEEVGNATLEAPFMDHTNSGNSSSTEETEVWVRVLARAGLTVACPPPFSPMSDDLTSPTSSRESSAIMGETAIAAAGANNNINTSNNLGGSDAGASSVGSGVWDAMFRTPKREAALDESLNTSKDSQSNRASVFEKMQLSTTIACGMCVQVEKWHDPETATPQEFVRLVGGQGWLPYRLDGRDVFYKTARPEFRFGSFWFRVQASRGVKVRWGPSKRAPSIKSEDGTETFRFECGEFLRASEIMTVFSDGEPVACHAKLYRNRHIRLHPGHEENRTLISLAAQAEWVQVFCQEHLYLEECAAEPKIERHRQGWRYNVVPDQGVRVRRGPSFAAIVTDAVLLGGESVLATERVTPAGDQLTWLRLKDGKGWVHDVDENGKDVMIAHSLRHRSRTSLRARQAGSREEVAYNTIIARLFHNDVPNEAYRPARDLPSHQIPP